MSSVLAPIAATIVSFALGYYYLVPRRTKRNHFIKVVFSAPNPFSPDSSFSSHVLPHSDIQELSPNLWYVSGTLPPNNPCLPRNMVIYRFPNTNQLLLYSVLCMKEETMKKMEKLGQVKYIVVPNGMHRLDAKVYKERYANAKVICSEIEKAKITEMVDVDDTIDNIIKTDSVFQSAADVLFPEGAYDDMGEYGFKVALEGKGKKGIDETKAMIFCDQFFNVQPEKADKMTKFIGSANGFGITKIGMFIAVEDPKRMRDWIQRMAKTAEDENVEILTMAHGDIVVGKANVVRSLKEAARKVLP